MHLYSPCFILYWDIDYTLQSYEYSLTKRRHEKDNRQLPEAERAIVHVFAIIRFRICWLNVLKSN